MEISTLSQKRAEMPKGTNKVLDRRTLENDFSSLIPLIKKGMEVLDVGCGSGPITKGIAERVGSDGNVIGLDINTDLIAMAKNKFTEESNLTFVNQSLFDFNPDKKFDLIVSARTLQWLSNPIDALVKIKSMLNQGGIVSILDYNHEKIQWQPAIPASMQLFYSRFLDWRHDAGMNNCIADDLADMFASVELINITIEDADEMDSVEEVNFIETAGIWNKVVEMRGPQLVQDGYITEGEIVSAFNDYSQWLEEEGQSMDMYLRAVTGYNLK
jgi:ubiquinone/menaquinone biosynthesis C-methylase UbiE